MRGMLSRLILSLLCACVCASAVVSAQEPGGRPAAMKVDEFGRLRGCDGGARLDNFAIELQNTPNAKGYIVARDSRERLRGSAHEWGVYFIHYFPRFRGLDESRIVLVDGAGVSGEDLKMELWLVPEGAEPPHIEPPGKEEARPFQGKYAEFGVVDDKLFFDVDGSSAGSFGESTVRGAYAELLKKQTDSQGYLVVYSPPGAAPGYWRRAGTREQQKLSWDDLPAGRLTVVNGGPLPPGEKAADGEEEEPRGHVELWVGAKESPPVRHVGEEETLSEATMVSDLSFWSDDDQVRAWAMGNLADLMRGDRRSLGCVVVYPGDNTQLSTDANGNDVPRPDIFKLAETWKAEFLKKHGFEPHRLVVINGPPQSSSSGRIETWAVPYGAPLPDPFANAEEPAGEEEEAEGEDGGEEQEPPPPGRIRGVNLKWQSRF
jgi:hypothetical protein